MPELKQISAKLPDDIIRELRQRTLDRFGTSRGQYIIMEEALRAYFAQNPVMKRT